MSSRTPPSLAYTMKSHAALLSALFPLLFADGVLSASSHDIGKSYRVFHNLGNESKMTSRGTIRIAPTTDDVNGGLSATFHPDDGAKLDIASFDAMVDSDAFYTIVVLDGGGEEMTSSLISVPYPPSGDERHVSLPVYRFN